MAGGGTAALFAYLLKRFPYDGLYGADSFAYYYQAQALLNEALGRAPLPGALYDTNGLQHWPVGYHLQIIVGFLFGGESLFGPRLLTIAMAVLCPVLVYALLGIFLSGEPRLARFLGGLTAASILPLYGTYTRIGLSLMSDIPSLFWALLAIYSFLKVWPPRGAGEALSPRARQLWAIEFGGTLGLSVLTRYGSAVMIAPLLVYALVSFVIGSRKAGESGTGQPGRRILPAISIAAFIVALSPQFIYLAGHNAGSGAGDFVDAMNVANIFANFSVSADGTAHYAQTMLGFYLLNPFWDTAAGFLSIPLVPLAIVGVGWLAWRRAWDLVALLLSWWILPALIYATTPYQAHRFTLIYLPALAIAIGLGVAGAAKALVASSGSASLLRVWRLRLAGLCLAVLLGVGVFQCWKATRDWVATHSAWQAADQALATLTRNAARMTPIEAGQPKAISFGATAALYYYTQWPMLELYNNDEPAIEQFLSGTGPRVVVVPVDSLKTQWAGTPLYGRWQWLRSTFLLTPEGKAGDYTVFRLSRALP